MIVEHSNLELRENRALDYFQNIVETVREPLIILDSDLRVTGASRSFYRTFSLSKQETEGRLINDDEEARMVACDALADEPNDQRRWTIGSSGASV